jgi:exodeoxyribonuclease V gamma subunit
VTLYVHRSERADRLVLGLAELLADPLPDVFAQEVVAVPARGTERWLAQQLSHRLGRRDGHSDGICAGVQFPHPNAVVAAVTGTDRDDPWAPDSLVWPLLEVIDQSIGEPWCSTLSAHLGHGMSTAEEQDRRGRRYAVARRLAGLFDGYATHRPAMLEAWAAGVPGDGIDPDLPADLAWQCELWRRVRERVATAGPEVTDSRLTDPVTRRAAALAALTADPEKVDLPQRLSLFGITRLPVSQLEVLEGLAENRDVHLWLTHPSPMLWNRIAQSPPALPLRRRLDPTATVAEHALLSSLGRDARELQLVLSNVSSVVDEHLAVDRPTGTLLGALQEGLRDDRQLAADDNRLLLAPGDHSVQVHACHGAARQVDVLREVLVGLLATDDTLEPRDVLVMCPDIEVYAPLIAAAFGLVDVVEGGHPAHGLRVRLADRALAQTNPLLATMARLLELADSRVTASQVLDLAAFPPVRRRFGFDDDDLEQLTAWVADAGIRWGVDAGGRGSFGLQRFAQNTWRSGLDRLLLGVTMSEEDQNWLDLALPLDDVGSSDVELAGSFAELVDRLATALSQLSSAQSLTGWLDALITGVTSLTSVPTGDEWQSAQLRTEMAFVRDGAGSWAEHTVLTLPDLRALLRGRLGGRPTRANFRTGTLTVCTMVPMRSVPHRVVCLLGLDDGVFPRSSGVDGDDIIARDPAVGERDPRGEDRQLMLDAILAATEHLIITYTGADERTGARRPPAVPLGELLDALDDTARTGSSESVRDRILIRHPLQPFDNRNVISGELGTDGPFSFDPAALAGAQAAARPPVPVPPFLPATLPPTAPDTVELADLIALLTHPARGFLRQRLDVAVRFEPDDPADNLTVELDALQRWKLGDRILRDRLAGTDEQTCRNVEWRRGMLPPGPLGGRQLDQVLAEVSPLVEAATPLMAAGRRTVDVLIDLSGGRRLTGSVPGLYGVRLITVTYSKLGARDRLRAWITLVALAAGHPETPWTAVTIGRGDPGRPQISVLGPVGAERAGQVLADLVELYGEGLRAPLESATKTSAAYAAARRADNDVPDSMRRARMRWASGDFPGEDADAANERIWGRRATLDALTSTPATGTNGETSRFGELALRLWGPLLDSERMGRP